MCDKSRDFTSWNLPDIMIEAGEWIMENEINVCDIIVDAYDDPDNEICSTVWRIKVTYIDD